VKRCRKCGEHKPLDEFNRDRRSDDGRYTYCQICHRAAATARYHTLDKVVVRRENRRRLLSKYALGHEEYEGMLVEQGRCCAICGVDRARPNTEAEWAIDHDHACCPGDGSCGRCVRGLLCFRCNVKLGILEDVEFTKSARAYLARHASDRLLAA
jgi:hypothetical protein